MTVYSYTIGYGGVEGQIETSVSDLPIVQNGHYWNPIAEIQSDLASIGADNTQPYWIDWDLTIVTSQLVKNAPSFKSPLKDSFIGVLTFLSGGAVIEKKFLNFQSQRFNFHGFWNLLPSLDYPASPSSPTVGQVDYILSSFSISPKPADSVVIYPEYADPSNMTAYIGYRAVLGNPGQTFVLTDFPNLFAEVI
jgi:hypothetical protein